MSHDSLFLVKAVPLGSRIKGCAFGRSEGSHVSKSVEWTQPQYCNSAPIYSLKVTFTQCSLWQTLLATSQYPLHMPLAKRRTLNGSEILPSPIWQEKDELTHLQGNPDYYQLITETTFLLPRSGLTAVWLNSGQQDFGSFSKKAFPGSPEWDRGGGGLFVSSGHESGKAAELEPRLGLPNLWTNSCVRLESPIM